MENNNEHTDIKEVADILRCSKTNAQNVRQGQLGRKFCAALTACQAPPECRTTSSRSRLHDRNLVV